MMPTAKPASLWAARQTIDSEIASCPLSMARSICIITICLVEPGVDQHADLGSAARISAPKIRTVFARKLGDTLLLMEGESRVAGFAVCHFGPATEAGEGNLFV